MNIHEVIIITMISLLLGNLHIIITVNEEWITPGSPYMAPVKARPKKELGTFVHATNLLKTNYLEF